MENKEFKKINVNSDVYKYLLFDFVPEKKLINIIKNLKEIFPKQKYWTNLSESTEEKKQEIYNKFERKGKLYKEIAKYWLSNYKEASEDFNKFVESFDLEISTEEVIKHFNDYKEKYKMNIVDIALFIHIYVEQVLGLQLFKESTEAIENELETFQKEINKN